MLAKVLPLTPLDISILLMSQAGRAALAEIEALESELAQVGWQLDAARRVIAVAMGAVKEEILD